jgi:hypothetical protein
VKGETLDRGYRASCQDHLGVKCYLIRFQLQRVSARRLNFYRDVFGTIRGGNGDYIIVASHLTVRDSCYLPTREENCASTNTTRIVTVRVSGAPNGVRVSVGIASPATAACGNTTWYSYEYSNSAPGTGPAWSAMLLAAQARQTAVR